MLYWIIVVRLVEQRSEYEDHEGIEMVGLHGFSLIRHGCIGCIVKMKRLDIGSEGVYDIVFNE